MSLSRANARADPRERRVDRAHVSRGAIAGVARARAVRSRWRSFPWRPISSSNSVPRHAQSKRNTGAGSAPTSVILLALEEKACGLAQFFFV